MPKKAIRRDLTALEDFVIVDSTNALSPSKEALEQEIKALLAKAKENEDELGYYQELRTISNTLVFVKISQFERFEVIIAENYIKYTKTL